MTINETPQHYGHVAGSWWYGCDACNPVDDSVSVRLQPLLNKEQVEAARLDAKVYTLIDAAEDFATFGDAKITVEFVVNWLNKRAESLENKSD